MKPIFAMVAVLLCAAPALACTQQEAMDKSTRLSQLVQAKMQQDPAAGQAMMQRMQPIMMANQQKMMSSNGVMDWDAVCRQYDDLLKTAAP